MIVVFNLQPFGFSKRFLLNKKIWRKNMTALTVKAWEIGNSLRNARLRISLLHEDTARMLKISREELSLFENGEVEIPKHLLDTIFAMGLMMMHVKNMMADYHHMTRQWRHMHNKCLTLQNKLSKIHHTPSPALD